MLVELGPSTVDSEIKQEEDLKTVEKGDDTGQEVDVVVDYDNQEDNGEETTRNERFLDD